jgi:hypothetical protein
VLSGGGRRPEGACRRRAHRAGGAAAGNDRACTYGHGRPTGRWLAAMLMAVAGCGVLVARRVGAEP